MEDVIAVLLWAVPVGLLAYLCWTTTNILRGLHRIYEKLDGAGDTPAVTEQQLSTSTSSSSSAISPEDR